MIKMGVCIETVFTDGVPGRHELYFGELNYPNIIKRIDNLDYDGYIGLEYFPSMDSEESLRRIRERIST